MNFNWIEVDKFFHYARPYRAVATIFSADGNVWVWEFINATVHGAGKVFSLEEAKDAVEKFKEHL